ncbi:hypothetical protein GCM10010168_20410 [Actinoplanes ianthinogenes]|uniref:Ricin B lectin domain-containing protein n=1 Tax=Actinoplanes ianthinogenes TaxID=122358 RepID=A0ABM7M7S1_9ACTN|nr:RICIN domain-containing protein [Actinoplanes ianthinogenes]BCJ47682.1 hypothetical protein Aiant_83390 [Actinoplanes ianthinogenes]GGR03436.1 hypothetical protein GCM10010168_20410 [Actinoplanes ianthinogenes]
MRWRTRLAAACAALSLVVAWPAPARADINDQWTTWISILPPGGPSASGRKVIDVRGRSLDPRATVQIWARQTTNNANQYWQMTKVYSVGSIHYYTIMNVRSGMCLDKSQDVPDADGNAVYQYPCIDGAYNQQWAFTPLETGAAAKWGLLVNRSDGRCLDATGGTDSYYDGAPLQVWLCNHRGYADWNQRWNIFL